MALAIHVVVHKLTDAVLAAFTRDDAKPNSDLVAEVVGDNLPVTVATDKTGTTAKDIIEYGSFTADDCIVEKVPGETDVTFDSVLDAPFGYVLIRDKQGAAQSVELATAWSGTVVNKTLTVTVPTALIGDGVDGLVRLITSTGTVVDQQVLFKQVDSQHTTQATVQLKAPAGSYTMLVFAKGYGPSINTGITLS